MASKNSVQTGFTAGSSNRPEIPLFKSRSYTFSHTTLCCLIAFSNKDKPHSLVNFAILLGFFFQLLSVQGFTWLSNFNNLQTELQIASILQTIGAVTWLLNLVLAVSFSVVQWTAITRLVTFWLAIVVQIVVMALWSAIIVSGVSQAFVFGWVAVGFYMMAVVFAVFVSFCKSD